MDDQKNEPEIQEQAPEPAESPAFRADDLMQDAAHASSKDNAADTKNLVSQGALPQLDLFDPDSKPADGREYVPSGKKLEEKEQNKDGGPALIEEPISKGKNPDGQEKKPVEGRSGEYNPPAKELERPASQF